jgi:hydroxyacylglutathione hydrolase
MDLKVSSTIGYERSHSELLRIADEDEFVRRSVAALGPQPPNFKNIVALNRGPLRVESLDVHPLTPRQVRQACDDGALLVDVRTELQFDEAHVPRSVSITALRAGFGSKLAWLVEREQPVVLIGRDDEDARHAAALAAAVGITNIAGYLAGGMTSWREEHLPVERIERITVPELHDRLEAREDLQVLDVRERTEWNAGHIPGSVHVPYHDIHGLPDKLDPGRPVAVICSSGQRSAPAASLLRRHGAGGVLHVVDGGVPLWKRQGWPLERHELARA